jgi:hypothetical protein
LYLICSYARVVVCDIQIFKETESH